MANSTKGVTRGIEARGQFDALMESVLARDDVTFEEDALGGVPRLWVLPADWRGDPPSARWLIQLWICRGLPPSYWAHCGESGSEGVHPGLSACSRTSFPSGHGRCDGM